MSSSDSDTGSASVSDSGSEGLQRANAHAAGTSGAPHTQLSGHPLQRPVNSTQSQSNDADYVQRTLAALALEYRQRGQQTQSFPSTPSSPRSVSSSMMAASTHTRSTLSSFRSPSAYTTSAAPSLTGSGPTARSDSLGTSSIASAGRQHYTLNESERESSEDEDTVRLDCTFGYLHCSETFHEVVAWDCHCRAHFRGHYPSNARCPFSGCDWSMGANSGQNIWAHRLRHLQVEHRDEDFVYRKVRPDRTEIDVLRRNGVIDAAGYQELRSDGRLSEQPVLHTTPRRREGRRRH